MTHFTDAKLNPASLSRCFKYSVGINSNGLVLRCCALRRCSSRTLLSGVAQRFLDTNITLPRATVASLWFNKRNEPLTESGRTLRGRRVAWDPYALNHGRRSTDRRERLSLATVDGTSLPMTSWIVHELHHDISYHSAWCWIFISDDDWRRYSSSRRHWRAHNLYTYTALDTDLGRISIYSYSQTNCLLYALPCILLMGGYYFAPRHAVGLSVPKLGRVALYSVALYSELIRII